MSWLLCLVSVIPEFRFLVASPFRSILHFGVVCRLIRTTKASATSHLLRKATADQARYLAESFSYSSPVIGHIGCR
jgi:hypothetical protein